MFVLQLQSCDRLPGDRGAWRSVGHVRTFTLESLFYTSQITPDGRLSSERGSKAEIKAPFTFQTLSAPHILHSTHFLISPSPPSSSSLCSYLSFLDSCCLPSASFLSLRSPVFSISRHSQRVVLHVRSCSSAMRGLLWVSHRSCVRT